MSRIQLALNVSNLDEAVTFYSRLFRSEPAKVRPGYANFAIAEPALKLVLIETSAARGSGTAGALNHIGVELEDREAVRVAAAGLVDGDLVTGDVRETVCCYALQDKVWVDDPDGLSWELYTVLADVDAANIDHDVPTRAGATGSSGCC